MACQPNPKAAGLDGRIAPAVMACLAAVTLVAGIAASTQAEAGLLLAKPAPFVTGEQDHHAGPAGRAAHRLCRSPVRILGTAAGQDARCKRAAV